MSTHDRLYELLEAVQRTAVQTGDIALGAAYLTGRKAGEIWDSGKILLQANRLEHEIGQRMQAMGELLYATHRGSPTDSEVLHERLQEVDRLKAELEALNVQLGRTAPAGKCSACGGGVQAGDKFCRSCGEEL